jgi:hypothetical protein
MPHCLEISDNLMHKHVGYGLPCANCRAYYAANIAVCPICGCRERVPANAEDIRRKCRTTISMTTTNQHPAMRVPRGLQQKALHEAWAAFGKEGEMRR